AQCGLLRVEAVLHIARLGAQHPETGAELGSGGGGVEVGADAARVGDRDERVVVDLGAGAADVRLGVHGGGGAEEGEGLVDDMAAEVVEQTSDLCGVAGLAPAALGLRSPPLEAGLE